MEEEVQSPSKRLTRGSVRAEIATVQAIEDRRVGLIVESIISIDDIWGTVAPHLDLVQISNLMCVCRSLRGCIRRMGFHGGIARMAWYLAHTNGNSTIKKRQKHYQDMRGKRPTNPAQRAVWDDRQREVDAFRDKWRPRIRSYDHYVGTWICRALCTDMTGWMYK